MAEQAENTRPTRRRSRRRKVAWIALIVLVLAVVVFARALIPAWSHWVWQELSAEAWPPIEPRARTVDFEHRFSGDLETRIYLGDLEVYRYSTNLCKSRKARQTPTCVEVELYFNNVMVLLPLVDPE